MTTTTTTNESPTQDATPDAPTAPAERLETMPLDRLHHLASTAPDAATRTRAKRVLAARQRPTEAERPPASYHVQLGRSHFGTLQPEVVVSRPRAHYREVLALLHELAARVERALATTREGWEVTITADYAGSAGQLMIALMDGWPTEAERAMAVLRAAVPTDAGPRPPEPRRPRPRRERGEQTAAPAAELSVEGAAGPVMLLESKSPPPPAANDAATSVTDPRDARREYRRLARRDADRFARQLLRARDRATLPECARSVADGAQPTAEYWSWLVAEWRVAYPEATTDGR